MQKIIPHLWFDKEATEAAAFYISIFPESQVISTTVIHNTPSGDCDIVSFTLWGKEFMGVVRVTYIIDADGRIAAVMPARRIKGHAQKVLETLRALPK